MNELAARTRDTWQGRRRGAAMGLALLVIVSMILLVSAGLFIVSVLWPQWRPAAAPDAPALPITVGNVLFNVPPAAIRIPVQRRTGTQERLDLVFTWPSLAPPDPRSKPAPGEEQSPVDRLFVTILPQSGTLTPFERLNAIYPRYLAQRQFLGPEGLTALSFRDGTPYQGEDLFYDATAPSRFLVRCTRPAPGGVIGTCLLERRLGAVDVTIRFPRDWLGDWRSVASAVDRVLASLRPTAM